MSQLSLDKDEAPWKQRFRAPITYASLARMAPERGIAISNRSGVFQLYAWDVPGDSLTQRTERAEGVGSGSLTPDGRFIFYLEDAHGNEIGHFVRVPFQGGVAEDITPELPLYSSFGFAISRASNLLAPLVVTDEGFQLYVIAVDHDGALAAPKRIFQSSGFTSGPVLSQDGAIAVVGSTERAETLQFSLVAIDTLSGQRIAELWDGPHTSVELGPPSPVAGDERMLATTNRTGAKRPLVWNPRTGERFDLMVDGLVGDVDCQDWSDDGKQALLCQYAGAVQRLYLYELTTHRLTRLNHPGGSYFGNYFAPNGEIWAQWSDSTHPTHLIALDGATGEQIRTVLPPSDVPESHPWRSITFPSSDGTEIQGWLGLPDGNGPFPLILETHGGPTWAIPEMFSPASQAWLDRGFAFVTINYRGSTTFGRDFEEQIHGDLGHWEVEDMVAARDYVVSKGIAHPDEIFLTGWSYGGFLTLLALGTRPDLWAGGMAGIAIADWTMNYEDSAETLKGYQRSIFGGTPDQQPDLYRRASPLTHVEAVTAPVLIIQGRNDTRTPARPIAEYERRMRELNKRIDVHWFEAGHGSYVVEQQIEHQELMHQFVDNALDG